MGMTDHFIIPRYGQWVGEYVNNNLKPGGKIAWLGQQQRGKYSDMLLAIEKHIKIKDLEHHFYDIENDNHPPEKNQWDAHKSWEGQVEGYDLVLGLRITYLIQSSSGLVANLKYAVEKNKKVVFDFSSGNLFDLGGGEKRQAWKIGSKNLIPHLADILPEEVVDYEVPDIDHLLTTDMLAEAGLKLKDLKVTKDPVKERYYMLTEITKV